MGTELLHPAIQRHLWLSLRWIGLWPMQERAVEPVLDGEDLVLASVPGWGRVEAALFPLVSRMLSEAWTDTSVLFVGEDGERLEWVAERFELLGDCVGRTAATDPAAGADLLLLTQTQFVDLGAAPGAWAGSLRALVVDDAQGFVTGPRATSHARVLAGLEERTRHGLQRIGLVGASDDADGVLSALSPPGRAGLVVRGRRR